MFISGITILVQLIISAYYFYKKNRIDFTDLQLNYDLTKQMFTYSAVNFIITLVYFLVLRADIFLVEKYCDKIILSNYLQAAKIGQMLLVLPGLLAGVIFPYTIDNSKVLSGKLAYICRILSVLYIVFFIAFLALGNFIFTWLLGEGFNLIYKIFAFSFVGVYCLSISLLLISYFEGINKLKIILVSLSVNFFILICADFILIPIYGYVAAASVFSISNLIGLYILTKKFMQNTEIPLNEILVLKRTDFERFNFRSMKNNKAFNPEN